MIGVEEILETLSGYIDDLWKLEGPAYNEERMRLFLEIVGNEVVRLVQTLLDEVLTSQIFLFPSFVHTDRMATYFFE